MLSKLKNRIDESVLDEIIELAEGAMVRPFSKKKPDASVTVIKAGEEENPLGEDEEMYKDSSEGMQSESEDDGLSDEDLDDLLEEYKLSKGR